MKYFKATIQEIREKTVFIEVPDDADQYIAIKQVGAGMLGGCLPDEENRKLWITDEDRIDHTEMKLTAIEEADMEKEEEYAERFYEMPDCVFWDEKKNCITEGWCD